MVRLFARLAVDYVPRIDHVQIDGRVLAFAALVSLGTGLLFGLAPALAASRTDVQHDLREVARGTVRRSRGCAAPWSSSSSRRPSSSSIGAGLVLEELLARGAGASRLRRVACVDRHDRTPLHVYEDDATIRQFYEGAPQPPVRASQASGRCDREQPAGVRQRMDVVADDRAHAPPAGEPPEVGYRTASAGYFAAMQIPVLEGAAWPTRHGRESLKVVVVNRALADRSSRAPRGRARVRLGPNPKAPWRTIVGIVGNVHHEGPDSSRRRSCSCRRRRT